MTKRILTFLFVVAVCSVAVFSCKKNPTNTKEDVTKNYFPLQFGRYITYEVDSTYYIDTSCEIINTSCQLKYAISDTFTDSKKRTSYIMDVYTRPYNGAIWRHNNVILLTPTQTTITNTADPITYELLYSQDNAQYIKLMFPIKNGFTWQGNKMVQVQDSVLSYLKDWTYSYRDLGLSYNNGSVNYDNTVTVIENNQAVSDQNIDSLSYASRTYAKEVYAYNVGMIYKEWHHTAKREDTSKCVRGYRVVMRAIEHN